MKRLELVGLKPCPHCHRAIAYLMTQDGEETLGIALDATRTRELSYNHEGPGGEKCMTGFLVRLLAASSYVPRQVILHWNQEGFLCSIIDLTTEMITCSPQEGLALAILASIPLFAEEEIFEHIGSFHAVNAKADRTKPQPKPKPTLH